MRTFSSEIPLEIAEEILSIDSNYEFIKLNEADEIICPCYYEVFEYFQNKGYIIAICRFYDFGDECFKDMFEWSVDGETMKKSDGGEEDTWHEAANSAIKCSLKFITENE